jgi:hypothetical protein
MAITYTPIATQTLTSTATSVTFSSIPATYTDLVLVIDAIRSSGDNSVGLQYNSDSGTNYSFTYLFGSGTTSTSGRSSSQTRVDVAYINTTRSTNVAHILNYSNTTTYKTSIGRFSPSTQYAGAYVGLWRNTAAINSINIINQDVANFASGSTFTLYGIKAA